MVAHNTIGWQAVNLRGTAGYHFRLLSKKGLCDAGPVATESG